MRQGAGRGVCVVSSDDSGMVLELVTSKFDFNRVVAGGSEFERLRIEEYMHGYTQRTGFPEMPVKGVFIDVPEGRRAVLKVLSTQTKTRQGFRVYPVPQEVTAEEGRAATVAEWFTLDAQAYTADAPYPAVAAGLGEVYIFRGQAKQRLLFYPLRFNPGTGELLHSERIRVRVEFVEMSAAADAARQRAPAAAEGGWTPPAGTAYKVSTAGEGIYQVTRDWLTAQGIGSAEIDAIDLSRVQLFNLGTEQAIHVYDANANNRLDAGDYIRFYAAAVPAAYAKYARYNVSWLVDAGSPSPLRMASLDGASAGGPLALSHTCTVHHELDQVYLQSAVGADGMERWIFSQVAMGSGFYGGGAAVDFSLPLPGALAGGDLTIRMYSPYAMEHAAAVSVNGAGIGSALWSGIGWSEAGFAGVSLLDGANTVSLRCEGALDKTAVDWFAVTYERAFEADSDSLTFSHAGGYRYRIDGFSSEDAQLYDITDPAAVARVVNGTFSGSGPFTLEVEPSEASGSHTYLAAASAALRVPLALARGSASNLGSPDNAADWILITHRLLGWEADGVRKGWVRDLVRLREGQGLRTVVVDVAEIFDEFGYGLPTPQAIKDFLTYAYESWQRPAPSYVLLVGDTTYDYKDNWNLGTVNYMPGYLIHTEHLGETISDDWYVQVSGEDALPDMAIGRLPAAAAAQAADMVAKIVAYETLRNSKSWERSVLLVADNQSAGEEWESVFETMGEDAAALLPAGMSAPQRFYLREYQQELLSTADLTADLIHAVDAGGLILHYSGHAGLNIWASEQIIDNRGGNYRQDLTGLANSGRFPFVINMSCLAGYFIYPYSGSGWQSLAEGFMLPADRGAVAALMPTGLTSTSGQHVLSNALYETVFVEDRRVLGDAVLQAKRELLANGGEGYADTSATFLFFGDPATRLKVPLPRRPKGLAAVQAGTSVNLSWSPAVDCDFNPVAGYRLYRRVTGATAFTRLSTALITAPEYADHAIGAAALSSSAVTFEYMVSAVDADGGESVTSAPAAITLSAAGSGSGSGRGGWAKGCLISSAASGGTPELLMPLAALALLACLVWLRRRRKG